MESKKMVPKSGEDYYADTMEYEKGVTKQEALNCEKGVFQNKFTDGLNTEESIFDKTALFIKK